ncbi:MAG: hypothetical protein SNJ64_00110 [Endomicrobiia bacterium]
MDVNKILRKNKINPNKPILLITARKSISNLIEAVKVYCPNVKLDKLSKNEMISLLETYGQSVIDYHPENYHQERGALLRVSEMLKKYGLDEDSYNSIDFN